jgi:tetratricopeptide (TPR) repeat protein
MPPPTPIVSQPAIAASAGGPAVATAPAVSEPFVDDGGTAMLHDLFEEFKEDMEEGSGQTEDPDTHYNLGMAFKEMGLLDEAIGELQKVCQSIDRGQPFSQSMQAFTWLANCFVEKGVPEASFKWYQKALSSGEDEDTKTAIHYELACAYEVANMRPEALRHFMEVYSANIDYRDVAERIKHLKS